MFNSKDDYINKSAERIRASPFVNDSSSSKCRSNFKMLNTKSKNYEEDEKLHGIEFSAKNNLMHNFQNSQKNYSIFNMYNYFFMFTFRTEMSPTMNNYYPHLLLSNMDENKLKLCETPIKFNNINNEMNWYPGTQGRDNLLPDSPLFATNLNFKSNKNLEISNSIQKINYCYNPSNITRKNLGFGVESSTVHNNIINNMNNIYNENNNNHLYNYNNNNNNNFQFYQPKKLFNNPQNHNGGPSRIQQEKISLERKIIMSSDDDHDSTINKKGHFNQKTEKANKLTSPTFCPKRNKLKDNCILKATNSMKKEKLINKRGTSRNKLMKSNNSRGKLQLKSDKKIKSVLILTPNDKLKGNTNLLKEKNPNYKDVNDILITEKAKKNKCTCSKTQCIKKYCECYSNGKFCVDCDCENCLNIPENVENLNEIRAKENNPLIKDKEDNLQKSNNIVCNCTKSGCRKKYCECFKAGKKCSEECRCIHCDNLDECKISSHLKKDKKLYLTEKKENSRLNYRNQIFFNDSSQNFLNESSKHSVYKIFDSNSFSLYNINVLICGQVISISEKNENFQKNSDKNYNVLRESQEILKSKNLLPINKINNKKLQRKIKKNNLNKSENLSEIRNKVNLIMSNKVEFPKEITYGRDIEINSKVNSINKNQISEKANEKNKYNFRRSARLSLNKCIDSDKEILIEKMYNISNNSHLNSEFNEETKNEIKITNGININNQNTRVNRNTMKNAIDDQNQRLDFYSSVLKKEIIKKVGSIISKKNSASKYISNNFNSLKDQFENMSEEENNINSRSNRKNLNDKYFIQEKVSNFNDSNKKEQISKITETPKLCEKKRYRNTTTAKVKILNEDIYIKTNSTMNQTPILNNDKNTKKKLIEVDRRIVKNLKY